MYLKLLEEAVLEERGETAHRLPECTADLDVTANIDKRYVENGEQRMDLYRRMAAIRSKEDADELLDEIVDRYGDPPKGVMNLIEVALLRARAAKAGVTDITQKSGELLLTLQTLRLEAITELCRQSELRGRCFLLPNAAKPMLKLRLRPKEDGLKAASRLIESYTENLQNFSEPFGNM